MAELSTDRRFHNLTQEQVQTLDQVLTEVIPIHGRGNFPTLEVKPKDIIHLVKNRLVKREIKVRDVRLNGSIASHVLVKENGTSYKDLDIIFGVELPSQEDFQIIKDVVLGCLLDFLPQGVNKDKITALTMKEAYVQKMVKVFNEHDRWSLISLSNNHGKNLELKFVNSLRRQFEFSVDSFQIILDRILESYLEAERRQAIQCHTCGEQASLVKNSSQLAPKEESPSISLDLKEPTNKALYLSAEDQELPSMDERPCENDEVVLQVDELPQPMEIAAETVEPVKVIKMKKPEKDRESLKGAEGELQESEAENETPVAHDTETHVEVKCSQNQHHEPEPPAEKTFAQRAEPEYVDKHQEHVDQHAKFYAQLMDSQKDTTPRSHAALALSPPRELPAITVVAESMYGDFEQAMDHLRYRLIATRNPEEIRGGGLLKYSNLLVRDFKPASETEIKSLERYMCSRFFIDFPDVHEQQRKIESYLRNHFIGEESSKYEYLMTLRRVVNESTVCLMGHERRQTLNMITVLALKVLGEQNAIPNTTNITCFYQPAPYMADHNFSSYYIAQNQPTLIYHPYPLHIHMQTGLV
ncbi:hypothetical protein SKAU_G00268100 [Synaphobranchus kaupii]|uniref:polynucleotide adenylyltransferase n=1 Tax=Synaphobranchus kaupii TaxID=118154 RepID=A0A9Q1F014_SYNKA|nr:hypothetical protein SKAU_G00268100 [Synaphobranchus kaupii]